MMIYQWKHGAHVQIEAQVAGEELERLRSINNGRLTSEMVLAAAQADESPLHEAFEWNDARAALAHRLDQARYLIRSVEVVVERSGAEPTPVRAFVSVERDTDRSYTSTAHALADEELRRQVLDRAWHELEAWRRRHAELTEFARVFSEIDQARLAFE